MLLLMCHAGADRYAVELRHVSAVLPRAELQCPSGLPPWLAGILVYRGTATPVMDLTQLTRGSDCPNRLSSRILILTTPWQGEERSFGLLAENVALSEVAPQLPDASASSGGPTALGELRLDSHGVFQLLDLERLLDAERRKTLFALASAEETR